MGSRKNSRGGTWVLAQCRSARAVWNRIQLDVESKQPQALPRSNCSLAKDSDANESSVQANVVDHVRVLSYQREIGRSLLTLTSGYEMTNWFNLNDERVFSDSFMEAQNSHMVNDVSLDGAFVSIGILR
ncbi:MAG: Lpg1974 family pore-forming outer membrane protein [Planctomycetota bacterium]